MIELLLKLMKAEVLVFDLLLLMTEWWWDLSIVLLMLMIELLL